MGDENHYDDERTLDEEEALGQPTKTASEELKELENDAEVPIEVILQRYYSSKNTVDSLPVDSSTSSQRHQEQNGCSSLEKEDATFQDNDGDDEYDGDEESDEDDERTLDEEEAMAGNGPDPKQEMDSLMEDANKPIEEILKEYYGIENVKKADKVENMESEQGQSCEKHKSDGASGSRHDSGVARLERQIDDPKTESLTENLAKGEMHLSRTTTVNYPVAIFFQYQSSDRRAYANSLVCAVVAFFSFLKSYLSPVVIIIDSPIFLVKNEHLLFKEEKKKRTGTPI